MGRRAVLWVLPLLLGALPADAAPAGLAGYYRIPLPGQGAGALVLAVASCGADRYCGKLVDLGPLPAKDVRNPSPAAQGRALCGLDVLSLTYDGTAGESSIHLLHGTFYDPRTGDENAANLWLGTGGELHVSARSGQPVVSRSYVRPSEVWQPVEAPQAACDATRPVS